MLIPAFLILASSISADVVILKNGKSYEGTITSQDADKIQIQTADGLETIYKITIRRITFTTAKQTPEEKAQAEKAAEQRASAEKAERERQARAAEEEKKEQKRLKEEADIRKENETLRRELALLKDEKKLRQTAEQETHGRSGWPSIWRSALLPGWGQFHRGDVLSSRVFAAGALAASYYFYTANRDYGDAKGYYRDASTLTALSMPTRNPDAIGASFVYAHQQRNLMRQRAAGANIALGMLGALYLTNVLEAVLYSRKSAPVSVFQESFNVVAVRASGPQVVLGLSIAY